ncbi:MAG: M48 family metallopeptidase [Bacteroidota bacterium]
MKRPNITIEAFNQSAIYRNSINQLMERSDSYHKHQQEVKGKIIKEELLQSITMLKTILLCILFLPQIVFSQENTNYTYHHNDTMPTSYNLHVNEIHENIYSGIPDKLKKEIFTYMTYIYAAQTAYETCNMINNGFVYHDWPELENYMNKILKEVVPPEFKKDTNVHVYIVRNGSYNAFNTGSGHIFVNVGLFKEVTDEATIAVILAHEFAHYYFKHSLYHYIAYETGEFDYGLGGESDKLSNKYSIKNELQADSMSFQLIYHSKYNVKAALNAFEMMGRLENNQVCKSLDRFKLKEVDHPLAGERYSTLLSYYNRWHNDTALYYVVSEEKFRRFKKETAPEILKCLIQQLNYDECIETAFRYHLNDPDNLQYIHYILESVRKICYQEPAQWKKLFITDRYYDTINNGGIVSKVKMKDHLFTKFNFNVLPYGIPEASKIKAKFYWTGDLKFKTNNEAFDFFCKVSEALGDHEYLLSNALSYITDSINMDKYLKKYLSYDTIEHREYAEAFLNRTLMSCNGNKKLMVLNEFNTKIKLGKLDIPVQSFGHDTCDELSCIVDSLAANSTDIKTLYLPSLKKYNMNEYLRLLDLERLTFVGNRKMDLKLNIFILNPDYWEIFRKYSSNEITFINCSYYEIDGRKKSLETYAALLNENFRNLLSQNQSNKYLSLLLSTVKVNSRGTYRIGYRSRDNKLDFNKNGYKAVVEEINYQLTAKKKYGIEIENKK